MLQIALHNAVDAELFAIKMNKWKIPEWLEREIKERDKFCVYCGVKLLKNMPAKGPRKNCATWEHIINDSKIITRENIALCCVACNASKGVKSLSDWMQSTYCHRKGITKNTVAEIVKSALKDIQQKKSFDHVKTVGCLNR